MRLARRHARGAARLAASVEGAPSAARRGRAAEWTRRWASTAAAPSAVEGSSAAHDGIVRVPPPTADETEAHRAELRRSLMVQSRFGWIFNLFGHSSHESIRIRQSRFLFNTSLDHVEQRGDGGFVAAVGLDPNSFRDRQVAIDLHVWLAHRLVSMDEARSPNEIAGWCESLQQELFDRHWEQTVQFIRDSELVLEISTNKELGQLQRNCLLAMGAYDSGLAATDGNLQLGAAIWSHLFASDASVEDARVERVAAYIRRELDVLGELDRSRLHWGQWRFGDASADAFDGARARAERDPSARIVVQDLSDVVPERSLSLPEGWAEAYAPDGQLYFYNEATRDAVWKRPSH